MTSVWYWALYTLAALILATVARSMWLTSRWTDRRTRILRSRLARQRQDYHWDRCRQSEYELAVHLTMRGHMDDEVPDRLVAAVTA